MTFQAEELDMGKPAQDAAPKTTERKKKKTEEPSFEEALSRLEALVRRLEDGNTPLDESLWDYEEAIRLVRLCSQRLEQAEQAVRVLQKTANGGIGEFPMPIDTEGNG
jgi:exodeoxyribonuclease VII small subunit